MTRSEFRDESLDLQTIRPTVPSDVIGPGTPALWAGGSVGFPSFIVRQPPINNLHKLIHDKIFRSSRKLGKTDSKSSKTQ